MFMGSDGGILGVGTPEIVRFSLVETSKQAHTNDLIQCVLSVLTRSVLLSFVWRCSVHTTYCCFNVYDLICFAWGSSFYMIGWHTIMIMDWLDLCMDGSLLSLSIFIYIHKNDLDYDFVGGLFCVGCGRFVQVGQGDWKVCAKFQNVGNASDGKF
jgi:hypothetical protein